MWLFLLLTLPFGLSENNLGNPFALALFLLPFGILWTGASYAGDLLFDAIFKRDYPHRLEANAVAWIVKVIILVHLIFVFRQLLCEWNCFDTAEYLQLWMACILLFVFTYVPFSLYGRYAYFHSLLGLGENNKDNIIIQGEGKDILSVSPEIIIYAQSDDNYVDFFLADDHHPGRKIVFRITLKYLEKQLESYPQFLRIHRSILVNIRYAIHLGDPSNIRQIKLAFRNFEIDLPVSRSYSEYLKELLTRPK